ncbi:MAG: GIY-YIG nuclease family protein [Candidatus Scalindua sp.]|nr:GIY-YIG nuclease family protein [Candidatus Scalindua sp.]
MTLFIVFDNFTLPQYIGMRNEVKQIIKEHNLGRVTSTKAKRPWSIIYEESFPTFVDARKKEKYLKSAAGRRFRKNMMGD